MMSAMDAPAFDEKFDVPPEPYPSVPGVEDCKRAARHRSMEKYGDQPEVKSMLFRYLNDLLTTQPPDSLEFMLDWAMKEIQNPMKVEPKVQVDRSKEMYNLRVDLKKKETHNAKKKKGVALKGKS